MRSDVKHERLEQLLAAKWRMLLGSAVLLTGGHEAGEDLLQHALERVLRRWRWVDGDPEPYLRQTMYNLATDRWRWLGRRHEVVTPIPVAAVADHADGVGLRDALVRALGQLPARQRAVLVLRYWEDRSEAEVAELLACSVGTVKSTASRGLRRMREVGGADLVTHIEEG
jgi:RNA polymerase sigma-70 factor (sigma-E family)